MLGVRVAGFLFLVGFCAAAQKTFTYDAPQCSGTENTVKTFIVPAGYQEVTATLVGASGGRGGNGNNAPKAGYGGTSTTTFSVTAGETLTLTVGCRGNGGGCSTCSAGGGGATAIEYDGQLMAVAGGGGGAAASNHQTAYTSTNHGHGRLGAFLPCRYSLMILCA